MNPVQFVANLSSSDTLDIEKLNISTNYSILINKIEQLAIGFQPNATNWSIDHQAVEIMINGYNDSTGHITRDNSETLIIDNSAHVLIPHGTIKLSNDTNDTDLTRVFSDIWIGVILALLVVFVVFFICAGFLFHKFKQWKNSYHTNPSEPTELSRRFQPDFEVESLPSYTVVSGLPTYDDALEEFRRARIILAPTMPKIFDMKENNIDIKLNIDANASILTSTTALTGEGISLNACSCGALNRAASSSVTSLQETPTSSRTKPDEAIISAPRDRSGSYPQKHFSVQIAFDAPVRHNVRQRVDLYRAVNRNNLLNAVANRGGVNQLNRPTIYRSTSSGSLINEQYLFKMRLGHRGSVS